jgi:hypothetical protein
VSWLRNRWLHRVLGLVLGGIFLYAAHAKVLDPRPLVTIIWNYRILPPGPVNLMAIYMPWMELLVGITLVTGFKLGRSPGHVHGGARDQCGPRHQRRLWLFLHQRGGRPERLAAGAP